jgi:hypothetical protein
MTQRMFQHLCRMALLACLTLAIVATGFAHRPPSSADAAMQAYILAGGAVTDLCGDADGDGMPDHGPCPACQITASADLPPPLALVRDAGLVLLAEISAPRARPMAARALDPAHGSRAPPLV